MNLRKKFKLPLDDDREHQDSSMWLSQLASPPYYSYTTLHIPRTECSRDFDACSPHALQQPYYFKIKVYV